MDSCLKGYLLPQFDDCSVSITGDTEICQSQSSNHILFQKWNGKFFHLPRLVTPKTFPWRRQNQYVFTKINVMNKYYLSYVYEWQKESLLYVIRIRLLICVQQLYNYFSEYTWMAAAKKRQEFKSEWHDV